ncbi:hypothetical protein SALBM217S_04947 [Streptomyces griseoloalbus]
MLFMGEEWAAGTPWQFFTDHTDPELAKAVSDGRRREFAAHGWAEQDVPDPQDPATRDRSCLDWSEPEREPHARMLAWYRQLLAVRRDHPDLTDPDLADTKVAYDEDRRWLAFRRGDVRVAVNLGTDPADIPLGSREARVLAAWEPVDVRARTARCGCRRSRRWCCCRSEAGGAGPGARPPLPDRRSRAGARRTASAAPRLRCRVAVS